ncbi:MAG: hypothetical protein CM1200mP14_17030 [Gammaproteobacteria bacterium]|nr:MAG: hypothetical protein CM1200mP14_17030 [Gammaproteobacteria bacterium]
MTLSPVFRSQHAVRLLEEHGVWARLEGDVEAQAEAVRIVQADLRTLIAEQFLTEAPLVPSADEVMTPEGLRFLKGVFFPHSFPVHLRFGRCSGSALEALCGTEFLYQGNDNRG